MIHLNVNNRVPAPGDCPALFCFLSCVKGEFMSLRVVQAGDWPEGISTPEDRARLARYAEALAFYEGDQWLGRRQRGEVRLTFNYARALLRKVASYSFPAPVTFSVPADEETPPSGGRWPKGPEGAEAASRA